MARYKRTSVNKQFPKGWVSKHGKIYYRVPESVRHLWDDKAWYPLGSTPTEAYQTWHEKVEPAQAKSINKVCDLMDRYELEVVTQKAPNTQRSNKSSIQRLRGVFGDMLPDDVKPSMAYQYFDKVQGKHGLVTARHDIAVLRHAFTKAVEWGVIDRNPLIQQLRLKSVKPRTRDIQDWEIQAALSVPVPVHPKAARGVLLGQNYIRFTLMTGARRGDILSIMLSDIKEDGIHITLNKTKDTTGRRHIYLWDEDGDLRATVAQVLALYGKRREDSPLFCTVNGDSYLDTSTGQTYGFNSVWSRFMKRLIENTDVEESFGDRDLRAKVAGDSDTLEDASNRLGHADTSITKRVYRRKPVSIRPLKNQGWKLSQSESEDQQKQGVK